MALNTIEYAQVMQTKLDNKAVQGLTSGWIDANAGQVIYNGGNKIRMPEITTSGLKDYDREKGYPEGSVSLTYKDYEMTMDRGTSFLLDAMDVNESNFIANCTSVVNDFQKNQVIPEIDAYRYSMMYAILSETERKMIYTADADTVLDALIDDIAKVRDELGETAPLVVIIAGKVKTMLERSEKFKKTLNVSDFKSGAVSLRLNQFDNNFLLPVPSSRMQTAYVFKNGKDTGEKEGGFAKAESAKQVNWIILPKSAPIAVTKQDKMKIITPEQNQKADAWFVGYRRYHELWIPEQRLTTCFVNAEG